MVSKTDQLKLILDTLGEPTEEDLSFITEKQARDYVRALKSKKKSKTNFKKKLRFTTLSIVEIFESMIEFNPFFRKSASEYLKHDIFDPVRKEELELLAPFKIKLEVDNEETFDYKTDRPLVHDARYYYETL